MKKQKSLANNTAKKRKILIGCAIGASVVIVAGIGLGVGYAVWHSKNSGGGPVDPIPPTPDDPVIPYSKLAITGTTLNGFIDNYVPPLGSKLVVPDTITTIENTAFDYCGAIISVDAENVIDIGYSAFQYCTSLTTVNTPSAATIGESAFLECTNLTTIYTNATSISGQFGGAFEKCTSLTTITTGNLTSIGARAFSGCPSLTIDGLKGLKVDNTTLFKHWFPDGANETNATGLIVTTDSADAIKTQGCLAVGAINLGSLAIIPETTFQLCASLTSVVATSVTDVSKRFINCSSLKSVETGVMLSSASVTTAFNGCPSLTIDGLKGLKVDNTTLFKHWFPDGANETNATGLIVTTDGADAIKTQGCLAVGAIDLGNATTIGEEAFNDCASLSSINFKSSSPISIGVSAFANCTNLKSLTTTGAVAIASNAFQNCTSLTSITTGGTLTSISSGAFSYCPSLTIDGLKGLKVNNTNLFKHWFPDGANETNATGLIVTTDSADAIKTQGCLAVGAIDLGNATTIGASAFSGCASLTSVIGCNIKSIGNTAFYGSTNLKSLTTGVLTSIGTNVFYNCLPSGNAYIPSGSTPWNENPSFLPKLANIAYWKYNFY